MRRNQERVAFVDQLKTNSGRLWAQATDHPFITELGDGSLSEFKFRRYFVQDYVFVNQLAKVAGLAVAKAPDLNAARPFGDFLSTLLGAEDSLFLGAFDVMKVPDHEFRNARPLPTTDGFSNYLVGLASAGTFADICCAMYVVEGVYLDWADRLERSNVRPGDSGTPLCGIYQQWVDIHTDSSLGPFVRFLASQVNSASPAQRRGRQVIFDQVARYEIAFWDMAYAGEEWP